MDTKIPRYTSPTPTTSVPGLPHPTPRGRDTGWIRATIGEPGSRFPHHGPFQRRSPITTWVSPAPFCNLDGLDHLASGPAF